MIMTKTAEAVENAEAIETSASNSAVTVTGGYDHAELLSGCVDSLKPVGDSAVGNLLDDAIHGTGSYRLMGAVIRADLLPTPETCVDDLMTGIALMHRQASDARTDGKRIPSVVPALVVAEPLENGERPVCLFLFVERDLVPDAVIWPLFKEMNVRLAGDTGQNYGFVHDAKGEAFRIIIQAANRVLRASGFATRIWGQPEAPVCNNPACPIHGHATEAEAREPSMSHRYHGQRTIGTNRPTVPPPALRQILRA